LVTWNERKGHGSGKAEKLPIDDSGSSGSIHDRSIHGSFHCVTRTAGQDFIDAVPKGGVGARALQR
jgi:hypothetical protein